MDAEIKAMQMRSPAQCSACEKAATELPLCSMIHHHTLKRRLTPAENEWPASLAAPLLRAVFFIGREDSFDARRGPGGVCCISNASGNRRTAPMSSDR